MIILDTSTKIDIVLAASATTQLQWYAAYIDTAGDTVGHADGVSNDTTDVEAVAAPASGSRMVRMLSIYNADSSAATVTVKIDDGTNERILAKKSISAGETLVYDSQCGWYVAFDAAASSGSYDGDITTLNISGATAIEEAVADNDLLVAYNTSETANRKVSLTALWTYIKSKIESVALTLGIKLTLGDNAAAAPLNVTPRSAAPTVPGANDIYLDDGTNTASGQKGWRRYTGLAWEDITGLPTTLISYASEIPDPTTSGTATGLRESITVGESVSLWDLLYLASDGKWWKADADADTTMPGMRLALEAASADASCKVLIRGKAYNTSWSWTTGGEIYASDTAGGLLQTTPTGSGDQKQYVGVATATNMIDFDPCPILAEVE